MRVFFLTGEWSALKRFVRGQVSEPEGMPSVYRLWLRYREHGYDVHVFMIGNFSQSRRLNWKGCNIHLVARQKFFASRNQKTRFKLRFPVDLIVMYRAAKKLGASRPPTVIYGLTPWMAYPAWALSKWYGATCVKRIYGTTLYEKWFQTNQKGQLIEEDGFGCQRMGNRLMTKIGCLPHFLAWLWPSDLIIITNDGTGGDKIASLLHIPESKICFWLNGIEKNWSAGQTDPVTVREELGIAQNQFILLCLSRLSEWKRQDRVVGAMPAILQEVPNAKLVLAGDGQARRSLEKQTRELAIHPHVQFIGAIPHSRVNEILSIADIFLQTNDWSCVGNSLLEALACGRTIVTWNVGGTCSVIKDGQNGLLLPDAEPARIAGAVVALAKNPERRQRLAQGAREYVKQHLQSWDERLDMEIDLVESTIRNRK